jgi:hypothetical protein
MIWLLIPILLIVIGIIHSRSADEKEIFWIWFAVGVAISLIIVISMVICTSEVLSFKINIPRIQKNLEAKQIEYDKVNADADACIEKYPLEELWSEKISRTFLLRLPEVKGDTLLKEKMDKLERIQKDIFELKAELNQTQANLDWHKARWVSTTLASPYMEK